LSTASCGPPCTPATGIGVGKVELARRSPSWWAWSWSYPLWTITLWELAVWKEESHTLRQIADSKVVEGDYFFAVGLETLDNTVESVIGSNSIKNARSGGNVEPSTYGDVLVSEIIGPPNIVDGYTEAVC